MKNKYLRIYVSAILLTFSSVFISCKQEVKFQQVEHLNTHHLDHLYEKIKVNDIDMAIVHIYADYPDYNYVDDEDEGMACVDDAARAALFYLDLYKSNPKEEYLNKHKYLTEFLMYMQADNGYFYNFIWNDYTINRDHKNSLPQPDWWSWRALWALTESHGYYKADDSLFVNKIWKSIERLVVNVKNEIPKEMKTENISGLKIPTWLPNNHAADQTSILLLGLVNYYIQTGDEIIKDYISLLCEGIIQMQINDSTDKYYGAFLSWQNHWHAYGNSQAYSLLKAYQILHDDKILKSALTELNNYYPQIVKDGYISSFSASKQDNKIKIENINQFPQIAYNIRPMIYSLCEAYKITNNINYLKSANKVTQWFLGDNPAQKVIYNKESGIVFDGINSDKEVNMNSGAESTIEALLSMQRIFEYGSSIKNNKK